MAISTTLTFTEKMTKQISSIMKYLDGLIGTLDEAEDAADSLEDALDGIDADAIDACEFALSQMQDEAEKVARELKDVDKAADSIDTKKIGRLERALREAAVAGEETAQALDYVETVAGPLEQVGALSLAASAAIGAGMYGLGSLSHSLNLKPLQAQLHATEQQMAKITEQVHKLYTSGLVETFDEARDSFGLFRRVLDGTDEEIRKIVEGSIGLEKITLGQISREDISKTLSVLEDEWNVGGMKGLDMIAFVVQQTQGDVSALLETIQEFGPNFKEAGISAERMVGMLLSVGDDFAKHGEAFTQAFTINLKRALDENALQALEPLFGEKKLFAFLDQLATGGKQAEKAIMAITAGIASIQDEAVRADVMSKLFKGPFEELGDESILKMLNAKPLEDFAGRAEEITELVQDDWLAMVNEMKLALKPIGDEVLNVAKPIFGFLTNMLKGIGDFAKNHPLLTKIAIGFMMILAAILAVVGVIALLGAMAMFAIGGIVAMQLAMSGFSFASLAALWPIILIILALVAVGWFLYNNWSTISSYLVAAWEWVKNSGAAVMAAISAAIQWAVDLWTNSFNSFVGFLSYLWGAIQTGFVHAFTTVGNWLNNWISGLFESGQRMILTIVDGILSVKDKIVGAITSVFNWVDRFLPHSDAELGPLSRLTDSGMAIPETMAIGVEAAGDSLVGAMGDVLGHVPTFDVLTPVFMQPSTPVASLAPSTIEQASSVSGGQNGAAAYIDFRPNIQVQLETQGVKDEKDIRRWAEELAEVLAEELHHVLTGYGVKVLD